MSLIWGWRNIFIKRADTLCPLYIYHFSNVTNFFLAKQKKNLINIFFSLWPFFVYFILYINYDFINVERWEYISKARNFLCKKKRKRKKMTGVGWSGFGSDIATRSSSSRGERELRPQPPLKCQRASRIQAISLLLHPPLHPYTRIIYIHNITTFAILKRKIFFFFNKKFGSVKKLLVKKISTSILIYKHYCVAYTFTLFNAVKLRDLYLLCLYIIFSEKGCSLSFSRRKLDWK